MLLAAALAGCAAGLGGEAAPVNPYTESSGDSSTDSPVDAAAPLVVPEHGPQQRQFNYEIAAPGRSRYELWHAASAYFSLGTGINHPRFEQLDEVAGTMEGSGLEPWRLPGSGICFTRYSLRFAADDGHARLELEAQLGESEGPLDCAEWPILPHDSYQQIVADFMRTADDLRTVLNAGNGAKGRRGY